MQSITRQIELFMNIANDTIFKPTSNDKKLGQTFDEMIRKLLQKVFLNPRSFELYVNYFKIQLKMILYEGMTKI